MAKTFRESALFYLVLCAALSSHAAERQWTIRFANLAGGGKKPLSVTARERDGRWVAATARMFNKCTQYGDLSGTPIADNKVKGRAVIHVAPDAWLPRDHKPFSVELDVDARVVGNGIKGSYKVAAVNSTDSDVLRRFRDKAGEVTGTGTPVDPVKIPGKATFELRLHGALVGGDPKFGERCLVLQLGLDGDKVTSIIHGALSKKDQVHSIAVSDLKQNTVTRSSDGIKGRIAIGTETLDMTPVVYTIELDARVLDKQVAGIYELAADIEGEDRIAVSGNFDGNWSKGLTPWKTDSRPWYAMVPGFKPPRPGEHPRLLFRRSDLDRLRRKAETPEGKAILARLRKTLDGDNGDTEPAKGRLTIGHIAGYGLLYQVTADEKYAELARGCFERALAGERDIDKRYSFRKPGGALRAGPSLGWTAVGYDLCYDAWDAVTREKFGRAIAEYDEGGENKDARANLDLETLTRGTMPPGSNHFGMQVGGAALALLAVTGEKFVDQKRIDKLLRIGERSMMRNMTEGFGDGGFFAEGDGTGSMSSQIAFLGALQAWKNAMGRDYINVERPNARMMTLKWIYLTIIRNGQPDFWPKRGAYTKNIWSREGKSGGGYFAFGMAGVTDEQKAALKWYYERFLLKHDAEKGTPYDTMARDPHGAVCSFVNWPVGMEARNPAEVLPHCYRDTIHGFVAWRNRWQDENDVVISVLLRTTRGYMSAESDGSLQIMGFGRKFQWGQAEGNIEYWWQNERGTATVMTTANVSTAVDFTGLSGAGVMLATTGKGDGMTFKMGEGAIVPGMPFRGKGPTVTLKFLTAGDVPAPTIKDYVVTVGKRTIALKDKNIVLGVVK